MPGSELASIKINEVTVRFGRGVGSISFSDDGVGEGVNCYEEGHLDAMKQAFFSGGGGGLLPYTCRYVPPQRVWFWHLLVLKTDIDFAHFGLESGIVFEGTMGAYEPIYHFNSK